jgi:hypothetical protein
LHQLGRDGRAGMLSMMKVAVLFLSHFFPRNSEVVLHFFSLLTIAQEVGNARTAGGLHHAGRRF